MSVAAKFLTPEWVDLVGTAAASAPTAGQRRSARVQIVVTGAPDGDTTWHLQVDGGNVDAGLGPVVDAEVVLTLTHADAVAVVQGELEPSVAFMQGRMKTAGDPGRLLDVLAATSSAAFRDARSEVAAATEV